MLYNCPQCKHRTVHFDLRCRYFICLSINPPCGFSSNYQIPKETKIDRLDHNIVQEMINEGNINRQDDRKIA